MKHINYQYGVVLEVRASELTQGKHGFAPEGFGPFKFPW